MCGDEVPHTIPLEMLNVINCAQAAVDLLSNETVMLIDNHGFAAGVAEYHAIACPGKEVS